MPFTSKTVILSLSKHLSLTTIVILNKVKQRSE